MIEDQARKKPKDVAKQAEREAARIAGKLDRRAALRLRESTPKKFNRAIEMTELSSSARKAEWKALAQAFVAEHGRSNHPSFKRLLCLLLPDCPVPVLARAVRSADWKERLAVASHPKTPPAIREQLAKDGNEFVRDAARSACQEGVGNDTR